VGVRWRYWAVEVASVVVACVEVAALSFDAAGVLSLAGGCAAGCWMMTVLVLVLVRPEGSPACAGWQRS